MSNDKLIKDIQKVFSHHHGDESDNMWREIICLVQDDFRARVKLEILDWIHDVILDECETIEEARESIVNESIKAKKDVK